MLVVPAAAAYYQSLRKEVGANIIACVLGNMLKDEIIDPNDHSKKCEVKSFKNLKKLLSQT